MKMLKCGEAVDSVTVQYFDRAPWIPEKKCLGLWKSDPKVQVMPQGSVALVAFTAVLLQYGIGTSIVAACNHVPAPLPATATSLIVYGFVWHVHLMATGTSAAAFLFRVVKRRELLCRGKLLAVECKLPAALPH